MSAPTIGDASLAAAAQVLEGHDAVAAAYLLGSAAAGRLRPDSDVDVAVLPRRGRGLSAEERMQLAARLAAVVGRDVDLGLLSTANVVYAKEAIVRGRRLFDRDPVATATFAMHALAMYAALQDERREVLRAYAA